MMDAAAARPVPCGIPATPTPVFANLEAQASRWRSPCTRAAVHLD